MVTIDLLLLLIVYFGTPTASLFLIWTWWDLPCKSLLIFLVYGADDVIFISDLNAFDTFAEVGILNTKLLLVLFVAILTEQRHFSSVFSEIIPGSKNFLHF